MTYQKIFVDNLTCKRRFHLSFDESDPKTEQVKITCPHCDVIIYEAKNHSAVKFIREENLVRTFVQAEKTTTHCEFND